MKGNLALFPTQIQYVRWNPSTTRELNRRLRREIEVLSQVDQTGIRWCRKNYPFGYTSYGSITDLPFRSSNFGELKSRIDRQVLKFAHSLEIDFSQGALQMTECWVNRMEKGCHHSYHLHPLSVISGTYYVDAPSGSGCFKIEDPRLPAFMGSAPRKPQAHLENRRFHRVEPEAGSILLFESWLKHEVEPHRGKRPRVSVSFNYGWIPSSN